MRAKEKYKNRILKLLKNKKKERRIKDQYEIFNMVREERDMGTKTFVTLLDNERIYEVNGKIGLRDDKDLFLFEDNERNLNILKELLRDKLSLVRVEIIFNTNLALNIESYKSMKDTYERLNIMGIKVEDDMELVQLAKTKLMPSKKIICDTCYIGESAFPNSKIKKYHMKRYHCLDTKLVVSLEKIF